MRKYLLRNIINEKGMTTKEFCDKANVSYSKLMKQMNDKMGVSVKDINKYCSILEIEDPAVKADIFLD